MATQSHARQPRNHTKEEVMTPQRQRRTKPTYNELLDRIAMLEAKVHRLSTTGNATKPRAALDILLDEMQDQMYSEHSNMVLVGWDIDGMKQLNTDHGEPGTNAKLLAAHTDIEHGIRAYDIYLVWSGDEHVVITEWDAALPMARRMQAAYAKQGITATFVIIDPRHYNNAHDAIEAQRILCGDHKRHMERNAIHDHR